MRGGDPAVEALRVVSLDAATRLAPLLAAGGEEFGGAWLRLMKAALDAGKGPAARDGAALAHALDAVWRTPPDAFPDAAAAAAWAMEVRPAIRHALDGSPVPVPARSGRTAARQAFTRNGRKILDVLEAHGTLRRAELARRTGLWPGACNRALGRLQSEGHVCVGREGVSRA